MRTRLLALALAASLAALGGCAALNSVVSDVTSFGDWPASRSPGRYVVERLPSQQNAQQDDIEAAGREALMQAGFTAAPDKASADVVVQFGARVTRTELSPWDDPLWGRWGVGLGFGRHFGWGGGVGWGYPAMATPRYEREVAVLLRDRASGQPLYEARASNEGALPANRATLTAMFGAALKDFPQASPQMHRVSVLLPGH
jgi:hypothetical protein